MHPTDAEIEYVASWLRAHLPGFGIEYANIDFDVTPFRARPPVGGPPLEFEISREAFEDHELETIVRDLEAHHTLERLKGRPDIRLLFDNLRRLRETDRHSWKG